MIIGDFNYPHIWWDILDMQKSDKSREFKFLEVPKDCYFTQHIDRPTRSRCQIANIHDLVITDEQNRNDDIDYQSPLGQSDHSVLIFKYKVHTVINTNPRILYTAMIEVTMKQCLQNLLKQIGLKSPN